MQHDYFQKRKQINLLKPGPMVKGERKSKLFANMLLFALFPLKWYATWQYSEKADFI